MHSCIHLSGIGGNPISRICTNWLRLYTASCETFIPWKKGLIEAKRNLSTHTKCMVEYQKETKEKHKLFERTYNIFVLQTGGTGRTLCGENSTVQRKSIAS